MKKALEIKEVTSFEIFEPSYPIELIPHQYIPRDFKISFTHISEDGLNLWSTSLRVRTVVDKVPRAIEVVIGGNSTDITGSTLKDHGRVDRAHLLYVAQEIRKLEALAAVEAIKRFHFDPLEELQERSVDAPKGKEVSPKVIESAEAKKLRRVVEDRNAKKQEPEFLREVAAVFIKARAERKRTNAAVKEYFDRKDGVDHPIKTVRGWVARARVYIPDAKPKNSSPTKSVKDVIKLSTQDKPAGKAVPTKKSTSTIKQGGNNVKKS